MTNIKFEKIYNNSPPEARLAVMRAQQIAGQKIDISEYEKLRHEVIENSHPEIKQLWKELEGNYDVEVCELVKQSRKIFAFKIRAPIGTFLDYGTKKELTDFLDKKNLRKKSIPSKYPETKERIITFFKISSLKCNCCGELGEHIEENRYIKISKTAEYYGIKNIEEWEEKMDKEMLWIKNNKEKVLSILPEVKEEWAESCDAVRQILSAYGSL